MKQFLHLSSVILNKAHIVHIAKKPSEYFIVTTQSLNSNFTDVHFYASKDLNRQDYDLITKFIDEDKQKP